MVGAFGMFANEAVQLLIGLHRCAGLDLLAAIRVERLLREDLAGEADAVAEVIPVLLMCSYS